MLKKIPFIKNDQVQQVLNSKIDNFRKAELISAICRINTLSIIKKAGSGHIGTSFSAIDLFIWIKLFLLLLSFLVSDNKSVSVTE